MKITFNGTGASEGFPALFCECEHCSRARIMDPKNFRMRSSCLIDESLLIDFSADTYARTLYGKLDLTKVTNLIVTHSHADHLYPQDLCKIIPPYGKHNRKVPLQVYGNEAVGNVLDSIGISKTKLSQYLSFNLMKPFTVYNIVGYSVTPLPANHDLQQECLIYVIVKSSKTVLYGHDSGYFFEETWKALKGHRFDCVILDCTSGAQECPYSSHMGIPDNIKVRERMYNEGMADKNTKFILTHFAHSFAPFYESMMEIAEKYGFIAAYDGFVIDI